MSCVNVNVTILIYMKQEEVEYVIKRLKRVKIDCHIVEVPYPSNTGVTYRITDKNDKTLCVMHSDTDETTFVMPGTLLFNRDNARCDPIDLYGFGEKKEDLKALTDKFIARQKICQKMYKLFKSEILKLRKDLREVGHDNVTVQARVKELNKNMNCAYTIQEIGIV